MRGLIRLYGFWYGCLGTLGAFAWYASALRGSFAFPSNWSIVEVIFALHCGAAVLTFQTQVRQAWRPVLSVTRNRIWLAKTLLALATFNFLFCMGMFLVAGIQGNQALKDKMVPLILTSFLLQNTVYIGVHWAFRPENLFSGSFIRAISNPLGLIFPGKKKT